MQVIITPKAQKHRDLLPKNILVKVNNKLKLLENDPLVGKKLSGELAELRSLRVWPYRIIYYIETATKKIYITAILHRQGVYK